MKRILIIYIFLINTSFVFAGSCLDIAQNLYFRNKSSNVLSLQNFLTQKGFLTAKPNGYFGPSTVNAVKLYQKSVGITANGNVGPATRTAIKKESCMTSPTFIATTTSSVMMVATSTKIISASTATTTATSTSNQQILISPPSINSIDTVTFISRGSTKASLVIHGNNFSVATNTIMLKPRDSARLYILGVFPSIDGKNIVASSSFMTRLIPCGVGCSEYLPVGSYDVIVKTPAGESNIGYMSVKGVTSSSSSGSDDRAVTQKAKKAKLGTITFSVSTDVSLESLSFVSSSTPFNMNNAKIVASNITPRNVYLKDEFTGEIITGSNSFNLKHRYFPGNQSKLYTVYGDFDTAVSGLVSFGFTLGVQDFVGKNLIEVKLPEFLVSVSG